MVSDKLFNINIFLYIIFVTLIPTGYKLMHIPVVPDYLLALALIIYAYCLFKFKKERNSFYNNILSFFQDSLGISMILLLFIMLISITYSKDKDLAFRETVRYFSYIVLFFIIKYKFNTKELIKKITVVFLISNGINVVIGIFQYFTGLGYNVIYLSYIQSKPRIAGTFDNPNAFGGYLVLCIFPIILLSLYESNFRKKLLYIALALMNLINLVFTLSRGAWVGFVLGTIFLIISYSWRLVYMLLPLIVLGTFIPPIAKRTRDFLDMYQNQSRIKIWQTAVKMVKDHPLLGVGNGNFIRCYNEYIRKYPKLRYEDIEVITSHNSILKMLSELGIIGGLSFIFILYFGIIKVRNVIRITKDVYLSTFFTGFLASIVSFLVMNCFDNLFFVPKVAVFFWMLLALSNAALTNGECVN